MKREDCRRVYRRLHAAYGPQGWWPARSPFEVMVGAVLTQNTAWVNVERAIATLRAARALTPATIARTPLRRLASWIKPSGYFNVKARRLQAMARWVVDSGGFAALHRRDTETLRADLLAVHGIGPETADDILLYAFARPVFVIDAYTRRIFGRLDLLPAAAHYEHLRESFEQTLGADVPVFNQYHALIVRHGKDVCKTKPRCDSCCLRADCAGAAVG